MRAALATLEVLEKEELGQRSIEAGKYVRARLAEALGDFAMVKEVRGVGLLMGIEFQPPPPTTSAGSVSRICGGASCHVRADLGVEPVSRFRVLRRCAEITSWC
jgi:4-aminobutyrate aminotransferase-like enzyme